MSSCVAATGTLSALWMAMVQKKNDVRDRRYLTEPKLAISEVAYLLGYSEPSPFHRAFRRWTGKTPSEFRRAVV